MTKPVYEHGGCRPPSVKQYVRELMLEVVEERDGRRVGLSYQEMLALIRKKFPTISYPGPHMGKPTRLSVKHLREYVYIMQAEDRSIRLPVRPRSKRSRRTHH